MYCVGKVWVCTVKGRGAGWAGLDCLSVCLVLRVPLDVGRSARACVSEQRDE